MVRRKEYGGGGMKKLLWVVKGGLVFVGYCLVLLFLMGVVEKVVQMVWGLD